ncbi:MAG: winged helix-turn-helix transcriptional regulator [Alcanivoracaceae bacterium]|nr:winged helix-turn-helix transcriptional regulator [Alcanivoracaceae bacterium]
MKNYQIYAILERISELIRVDSRQTGIRYSLHPIQMEALHYLSICNKYSDTPMAVTDYLGQTKGTISQTLKALEKKGCVIKHPDSKDKRVTHLLVTNKGKDIIKSSLPTPMFSNALNSISATESDEIIFTLKKLLSTMLETNNIKSFGVCRTCIYNQAINDGSFYCNLLKQPLDIKDVQLICKEHKVTN